MEHNVLIKIDSVQRCDGEENSISLSVKGLYRKQNDAIYLLYDEYSGEPPEKYRVILKIKGGHAVMSRKGAVSSRLEFAEGEHTCCDYNTGAGILPLTVCTHSISSRHAPGGREIVALTYDLCHNNMLLSSNEITISISAY